MLKRFGHFDCTPASTPYDGSIHLRKNKEQSVSQSEYAQIIGSLMHLMNYTRLTLLMPWDDLVVTLTVLIRTIGQHYIERKSI